MEEIDVLNVTLWSVQILLGIFFVAAGLPKMLGRGMERWVGFSDLPRGEVVFVGVTELLGGAALIVPMATGVLPWLTPLAAIGLAIAVLMAAGFHVRADERLNVVETCLLAAIAGGVAIGRWDLVRADISPWVLVVVLGVLVPAAIVNIVVLVRGSTEASVHAP
ncbi:MAG: DoxX family protein [Actinomycetota bacterium]